MNSPVIHSSPSSSSQDQLSSSSSSFVKTFLLISSRKFGLRQVPLTCVTMQPHSRVSFLSPSTQSLRSLTAVAAAESVQPGMSGNTYQKVFRVCVQLPDIRRKEEREITFHFIHRFLPAVVIVLVVAAAADAALSPPHSGC
jgi:hypothetical protein